MQLAINQAQKALDTGEVPVGAVFVDESGQVVAESGNLTNQTKNATTHCEINCIRSMFEKCGFDNSELMKITRKLTLYVTCEPCLMCAHALNQI